LMMEATRSSETSVLTRTSRLKISENGIFETFILCLFCRKDVLRAPEI
jgi:hypothetical protein